MSEDAKRFYKSGQPVLQRLLPFWLASLVDRAKVMLIPLVMLMMPLLRAAPPLMRWRTRRKIYLWYSDLREIDQRLVAGLTGSRAGPGTRATERDRAPGGSRRCPAELHGGVLSSAPASGDVATARRLAAPQKAIPPRSGRTLNAPDQSHTSRREARTHTGGAPRKALFYVSTYAAWTSACRWNNRYAQILTGKRLRHVGGLIGKP